MQDLIRQTNIDLFHPVQTTENSALILADCLDAMRALPDASVDMVLCDLPYGTTACKWDAVIPFDALWAEYRRVTKPYATIVLTAGQPFTTALIASNLSMFRYCWVWEKSRASGFAQAKNKPLQAHEDICVFSDGVTVHAGQSAKRMTYNPQGLVECNKEMKNSATHMGAGSNSAFAGRKNRSETYIQTATGYPRSVLQFASESGTVHPTQKPVALMEYLIRTYTTKGDTVLDNTMGSGTTGVACENTGRRFIGIERDPTYFDVAVCRVSDAALFGPA